MSTHNVRFYGSSPNYYQVVLLTSPLMSLTETVFPIVKFGVHCDRGTAISFKIFGTLIEVYGIFI